LSPKLPSSLSPSACLSLLLPMSAVIVPWVVVFLANSTANGPARMEPGPTAGCRRAEGGAPASTDGLHPESQNVRQTNCGRSKASADGREKSVLP
jgi:hypothetical protein